MTDAPPNSVPKGAKVSHIDAEGCDGRKVVGPRQDMDDSQGLRAAKIAKEKQQTRMNTLMRTRNIGKRRHPAKITLFVTYETSGTQR